MKSRSLVVTLIALVVSLAAAALMPAVGLGDPASDLSAAQAEESAAKSKLTGSERVLAQAEDALAPVAAKADAADEAAAAASAEVEEVESELIAEREAAADDVAAAEAGYDDEKSSHDTTTAIGIGIVLISLLVAAGAFAFSRFRDWPLSKALTQSLAGLLGVICIGGLLLAFVPTKPEAPEFSAETKELAMAAEGDPADPPSPELEAAQAEADPLVARAEPLDAARDTAEGLVTEAEDAAQGDGRVLASAQRNVKVAENRIDRIEAAEARKIAHIEAVEQEEATFREEATSIDYNQLQKNADAYKGEKVVYTGQILQIQEEAGFGFMLLSVTDEGYGFWDDNIWVNFYEPIGAAEEDIITVYGKITGSEEYETQIGGSTYVPRMNAKYIDE